MTNFDAGKIAREEEQDRIAELCCHLWDRIQCAIEIAIDKHNSEEAKRGFPPASPDEIRVALSWVISSHFGANSAEELDRIIEEYMHDNAAYKLGEKQ